jgi:hypothetical protein
MVHPTQILLPGFMPNLSDYDRLDLNKENKKLYTFWSDGKKKDYDTYVIKCIEVCKKILKGDADEVEVSSLPKKSPKLFVLIGHSTGCNVILNVNFQEKIVNKYRDKIKLISLLCPAIYIDMPNSKSPFHFTLSDDIATKILINLIEQVPLSFSFPKWLLVPKDLFPSSSLLSKEKKENKYLTVNGPEFASYLKAYANGGDELTSEKTMNVEVVLVLKNNNEADYLVNNEAVIKKIQSLASVIDSDLISIKLIEGDHESPLYDKRFVNMRI